MRWEDLIRSELDGMVPYSPGLRASQVRERSGKDRILKLSSNEHPCGPVPQAAEAVRKVAGRVNRYPDGAADALERRLSEHLGVPRRNLVIGNGSNEILRLIGQVVLRPGDEVAYAWPSFVVYPMVAAMFGARSVQVPLDGDDAHDLEALLAAVTERTRLLFLCNPNNPTGTIYRSAAFESFMERVPEHVLVVVDEAYFEFVTDTGCPDGLRRFDGESPYVVTRTFSKVYSLAGLRVGYAAVPEPLARAVDKVREPFNVNIPAQVAAYYSLEAAAEVTRRRAENDALRRSLAGVLDELGAGHAESHTNFVYVRTDRAKDVFEALLDEGIVVRDFGTSPALRIGIGTPEDMHYVEGALGRVAERIGGI